MRLASIRDACGHAGAVVLRPLLFALYFLSGLVPRRRDLWVFGSWGGKRFADNAAAFFLYAGTVHDARVERVWISRSPKLVRSLRSHGHEAHLAWSPRGIARTMRAGVFVFDCFIKDVNYWTSRGAKRINLWSGVPIKTFERDIDQPKSRYYKLFHGSALERWIFGVLMPWHVDRPDMLICTSPIMQDVIARAFSVPPATIAVTGYPRTDLLFEQDFSFDVLSEWTPASFSSAVEKGETIFIYLPTFRDTGQAYLELDWQRLDDFLAANDATLFYKLHPQDSTSVTPDHRKIRALPQHIDLYTLLGRTDALISDYSSVIFDYMLTGKDIIAYLPDHEEFLSQNRSLNFDLDEIVDARCHTFDELVSAMERTLQRQPQPLSGNRAAALERFHTHSDGAASSRVMEAIRKTLASEARAVTIRVDGEASADA